MDMRDFDVRDVACPECRVARWEPCLKPDGRPLNWEDFHSGRFKQMASRLVMQTEDSLTLIFSCYPANAIVDATACPICPAAIGVPCAPPDAENESGEVHDARISAFCRELRGDLV